MTKNTFTVVVTTICIDIFLQHDFIASQCTGFISTEYVHCSKILNSIEILYYCFLFGHGYRSFRKVGSHNHWQHFRGKPHCNGYGKNESLEPVSFRETIHEKHKWNHYQHKANQQEADFTNTFIKSCSGTVSNQTFCNRTQICFIPCFINNTFCCATYHIGTHITNIVQLYDASFPKLLALYLRKLLYRLGLSCQ